MGDDDFGHVCRTRLADDGVDLTYLEVAPDAPTGVAFVRYREDGSRAFIFHVAGAAAGRLSARPVEAHMADFDCVHLMGSSAFSDRAVDTLSDIYDLAHDQGVPVSFDPNIRREMLTSDHYVQALSKLLYGATYILASEGEMQVLMGEKSDAECARELLAGSARVVVVKKGAAGSAVFTADGEEVAVPGITVEELDPTGAGDCFGGTFLALILQGMTPGEAARYATIAGGLSVTARGPMSGNRALAALEEYAAAHA